MASFSFVRVAALRPPPDSNSIIVSIVLRVASVLENFWRHYYFYYKYLPSTINCR